MKKKLTENQMFALFDKMLEIAKQLHNASGDVLENTDPAAIPITFPEGQLNPNCPGIELALKDVEKQIAKLRKSIEKVKTSGWY